MRYKIRKLLVMWKKFDMDLKFDCDTECGFFAPPEFSVPPPPLPPYLKELPKCSDDSSSEFEMCSLIPVSWDSVGVLKTFTSASDLLRDVEG